MYCRSVAAPKGMTRLNWSVVKCYPDSSSVFSTGEKMNSSISQTCYKHENHTSIARLIIFTAMIMCTAFYSNKVSANCTVAGDIVRPYHRHFPSSTIEVDSSLPMYSTLGTITSYTTTNILTELICTEQYVSLLTTSNRPAHSSGIYETGLPGIGMKLSIPVFAPTIPGSIIHDAATSPSIYHYVPAIIELVKIGYIPSGGNIPTGSLLTVNLPDSNYLQVIDAALTAPITIKLARPSCAAITPNLTINLGEISILDFNSSGRTTPDNFSIDLTCTGGTTSADLHVTLTDANNPANTTSQLGLSPDSTAEGIALEVNNRFGVVSFGPEMEGLGNPGQWTDGSTGAGSYSIPLSVNYVRLPGPIKGGTANSGVTYTLNYD